MDGRMDDRPSSENVGQVGQGSDAVAWPAGLCPCGHESRHCSPRACADRPSPEEALVMLLRTAKGLTGGELHPGVAASQVYVALGALRDYVAHDGCRWEWKGAERGWWCQHGENAMQGVRPAASCADLRRYTLSLAEPQLVPSQPAVPELVVLSGGKELFRWPTRPTIPPEKARSVQVFAYCGGVRVWSGPVRSMLSGDSMALSGGFHVRHEDGPGPVTVELSAYVDGTRALWWEVRTDGPRLELNDTLRMEKGGLVREGADHGA